MRRIVKKILFLTIILWLGAFISCFEEAPEEEFTVKVICNGSTFTGYVLPDNENAIPLTPVIIGSSIYTFEARFEGINTIFVSATVPGSVDASLSIFIYREDNKVKDATITQVATTSTSQTITLSYDIDDE